MIGFNKPYYTGKELDYIKQAFELEKLSGNGKFTKLCQDLLENRYGILKVLLTTSCTDALEMAALLINTGPADEIIMPSYTFVSTANAFVLRGANIIFADSAPDNPNINLDHLEALITKKTKAIVVVHYAGISCDMDRVMTIASKYNLYVIEDAAQAIESTYKGRPLGSIGHLGCFSFHETKNIISGEGGALLINDSSFAERAEIIWEKGTNRNAFFKGLVDKYNWVDIGSSFLPSEIIAALLFSQLNIIDFIQQKRKSIWEQYFNGLKDWARENDVVLPFVPHCSGNNAHMFYLVLKSVEERDNLIQKLKNHRILSVFHYLSLHKSPYYLSKHDGIVLKNADRYSDCLLRLPLYVDLTAGNVNTIINIIKS